MTVRMLLRALSALRALLRRHRAERDLDEELRFHLEREEEALIAAGHSPAEARRRARAAFGGLGAIEEECREARGAYVLETLGQDLRHGLRTMGRNPGFTLTVVLTLGCTIGAVSTASTLAHTLFLRPLPVPDADELLRVRATRRQGTEPGFVSWPDYVHFRDSTRTLEGLAAHYPTAPLVVGVGDAPGRAPGSDRAGGAQEVNGAVVSANFFDLLRLEPALGRFFRPEEDRVPGRDRVVVLSHDLWQAWFGGSPEALGARLEINGVGFRVIGVAPQGFHGTDPLPSQLYLPTMMLPVGYRWCEDALARDCTILQMIGRLEESADVERAGAEMRTLLPPRWAQAAEGDNSGIEVTTARGTEPGPESRRFLALLGAVAGVLLLACCANLAGLLIARAGVRSRELAIRGALGASRGRLARQLLTESSLLALAGGVLGVVLSVGLTRLLDVAFFSTRVQGYARHYDFDLDPGVVLAVLGVSLGAGLTFGTLPALIGARRGATGSGLRSRGAPPADSRGRSRWLLGAQTAIAVALVVVAGQLALGARQLLAGTGFEPSRVALLRLRPRLLEYPPERAQRYLRDAVERLEALPGVQSVSMVGTGVALWGFTADVATAGAVPGNSDQDTGTNAAGRDVTEGDGTGTQAAESEPGRYATEAGGPGARAAVGPDPDHRRPAPTVLRTGYIEVGPRYFETLGTPVLRGREFQAGDAVESEPVAVVNETAAALLWPDAAAIGARLRVEGVERAVVGVVADVPLQSRAEPPRPYVYTPFWQNPLQVDARLQVRVTGAPQSMFPALVGAVREVDPDVPVSETMTLGQRVADAYRPLRMSVTAASYAGALAVVLCAVGLYASLATSVARRRRELGIRKAIGASSRRVVATVTREGTSVLLAGAVAGLGLAAAGGRLLRHMLYGPAAADALLYLAAGLLVMAVGLVASWLPARRAARIAPMEALRLE